MWLKAIHLREVGHFATGVRIDGLTPGLNVLSAPNEAGKSTLFRAVDVLFREKHTSAKAHKPGAPATAKTLQPASGGAPWVSCAFSIDDVDWTLTKQFLQQRSAELARSDGGETLRGEDVDPRLAKLLARAVGFEGLLPLLWVGQREGLVWRSPSAGVQTTLRGLVEHEAAEAVGGGALEAVLAATARDLDSLMTDKRSGARRNGPLDHAARTLADCERELAAASDAAATAASRREDADDLRMQLADLNNAETNAIATGVIAKLKQQLDAHDAADEKHKGAQQRVELVSRDLKDAEMRLASIDELGKGRARLQGDAPRVDALQVALEKEQVALSAAEAELAAARKRLDAIDTITRAAASARRKFEAVERHGAIAAQLSEAERLVDELKVTEARLAANMATAERLQDIGNAERRIATLQSRLTASAPTVGVSYEAGATRRVEIDGVPVADGASVTAENRLVLNIPGVGQVTVTPAASGERDAALSALRDTQDDLGAWLAEIGVETPDAARERARERQNDVQSSKMVQARIKDRAPDGLEALSREERRLGEIVSTAEIAAGDARALGEAARHDIADLPALDADSDTLSSALDDAREAVRKSEKTMDGLKDSVADIEDQCRTLLFDRRQLEARIGDIVDSLGIAAAASVAASDLAALREATLAQKSEADDAYRAAVAARDEYAKATLSDDARARVVEQFERAQADLHTREKLARKLSGDLRQLEGAMEADRQQGLGERLRRAENDLAVSRDELERLQRKANALVLLERELKAEKTSQSETLVGPIIARMVELAAPVIGRAEMQIGPDFSEPVVLRAGTALELERLSGGTQEQIAILSRLAYGAILSEHAHPLPLVLDDALVYADDQRRRAMFQALSDAADRHQVIVLTCQSRAADELAGDFGATQVALRGDDITARVEHRAVG